MSVARRALLGYLLLFVVSFAAMGFVNVQRVLLAVWLLDYTLTWLEAGRRIRALWNAALAVLALHAVPILAAAESIHQMTATYHSDWGPGILELWMHPFMPWLELLPGRIIGHVSDIYLVTIALPFVLSGWALICWRWGRQQFLQRTSLPSPAEPTS